jgi:hypothetical protein
MPNQARRLDQTAFQLPVEFAHHLGRLGKEVVTLVDGQLNAGRHSVQFNAAGLSSGVYFYRMQAGSYLEAKKLLSSREQRR